METYSTRSKYIAKDGLLVIHLTKEFINKTLNVAVTVKEELEERKWEMGSNLDF